MFQHPSLDYILGPLSIACPRCHATSGAQDEVDRHTYMHTLLLTRREEEEKKGVGTRPTPTTPHTYTHTHTHTTMSFHGIWRSTTKHPLS
jgi:hypothetical protein